MAELIYILCATTALICAILLWRGYRKTRVRLLLWSSVCFVGLTAENVLLHLDRITFREIDLSIYRHVVGVTALLLLVYALIWESK